MNDIHETIKKHQITKNNLELSLKQSLYRQAMGSDFIRTRIVPERQDEYTEKEVLYRYYDHAERGQRQVKKLRALFGVTEFGDAIEQQNHILEITDTVGLVAISYRALCDFNERFLENQCFLLEGDLHGLLFGDILYEIANGVAHVRSRDVKNVPERLKRLRELNNKTSSSGMAMNGRLAHEIYSSHVINGIYDLLHRNFIQPETTCFDLVIEELLKIEPNLLRFAPYNEEKPSEC